MFNMENQQGPAGQHRGLCSILCNNLMVPRGKERVRDSQGVWDGHGHTAVFNTENQQGPAAQHRELCSASRGSLARRGAGGGRVRVCVWLSPCAVHLKPSPTVTHLDSNTKHVEVGNHSLLQGTFPRTPGIHPPSPASAGPFFTAEWPGVLRSV